jgi:hypothetical protein
MKNNTLIILGLLLLPCIGFTQAPVQVVTAPFLEAQASTQTTLATQQTTLLASTQASLAAIEQAEKKVEKIKEKVDWIKNLQSMQEFITMLETIACMIRDLNGNVALYHNLVGSRASCYLNFKYQVNINQLRKSVDIINVVLAEGSAMDRGQRVQAYEIAYLNFTQSQGTLHELETFIIRKINQMNRQKKYKESLTQINSFKR